jgi:hypothetical protein
MQASTGAGPSAEEDEAAAVQQALELVQVMRAALRDIPDARGRLDAMYKRNKQLERQLEVAARARDPVRALDLLLEAADRGTRPSLLCFERASDAMAKVSSPEPIMRLRALCTLHGILPSPLMLRRLLQLYARLRYAPGVHACIVDMEQLMNPGSDTLIATICLAYYSIGLHDRAFQIIDLCRGVPVEPPTQSASSAAAAAASAADGVGAGEMEVLGGTDSAADGPAAWKAVETNATDTAVFILERLCRQHRKNLHERLLKRSYATADAAAAARREWSHEVYTFYRSLFTYLLMSGSARPEEFAVLLEHCAVHQVADLLVEMLPHARVVETLHAHPHLLQMVFGSVLGASCAAGEPHCAVAACVGLHHSASFVPAAPPPSLALSLSLLLFRAASARRLQPSQRSTTTACTRPTRRACTR